MKMTKSILYILIALMFSGCSSLRQAELQSGNPDKAVAEVNAIKQSALRDQVDVLADKQFEQGSNYLAEAQRDLKRGAEAKSVLENAGIAKAFFQDAEKTAAPRKSFGKRILEARQSALQAGLRQNPGLVKLLEDLDDDLKDDTKQFSKSLDPEEFSEFQKKYLVLEGKAVQYRELGGAMQAIEKAKKHDADDLAPKSLKDASFDYKAAMNIIAQSPRSPAIYKKSVDASLASATLLSDVMNVIMGAKGTPENIAVQIVKQKRALGELTSSVGRLTANLESTKQNLQAKEGELKQKDDVLKSQEQQLARASRQVRFQKAMDEARKMLPQTDALVYQQGNQLVFRLKRVNFQSGKAVIPDSSKPLLTQVDSIIKKLDAERVIVEGHTDSVGSEKVNQKLSTDRATAVAYYLSSLKGGYKISYVGYGESKPIASNETADGRATNRRVDLVVSVKE